MLPVPGGCPVLATRAWNWPHWLRARGCWSQCPGPAAPSPGWPSLQREQPCYPDATKNHNTSSCWHSGLSSQGLLTFQVWSLWAPAQEPCRIPPTAAMPSNPMQHFLALWMQMNQMGLGLGRGRGHSISYSVKWLGWLLAGFGLCPVRTLCPLWAAAHGTGCQPCSVCWPGAWPCEDAPPWCDGCTTSSGLGPCQPRGCEEPRGCGVGNSPCGHRHPLLPLEHGSALVTGASCGSSSGCLSEFKRKNGFQHMKPCS